jgi:hypothetical protein
MRSSRLQAQSSAAPAAIFAYAYSARVELVPFPVKLFEIHLVGRLSRKGATSVLPQTTQPP